MEEEFDKLDLNGDGTLSKNEIETILTKPIEGLNMDEMSEEFVQIFDADGDGEISKEEYLKIFGAIFDKTIDAIATDSKSLKKDSLMSKVSKFNLKSMQSIEK